MPTGQEISATGTSRAALPWPAWQARCCFRLGYDEPGDAGIPAAHAAAGSGRGDAARHHRRRLPPGHQADDPAQPEPGGSRPAGARDLHDHCGRRDHLGGGRSAVAITEAVLVAPEGTVAIGVVSRMADLLPLMGLVMLRHGRLQKAVVQHVVAAIVVAEVIALATLTGHADALAVAIWPCRRPAPATARDRP